MIDAADPDGNEFCGLSCRELHGLGPAAP